VTDDDVSATCDELTVTVLNANPLVNSGDDVAVAEGQVFDLESAFFDAGMLDTHTATVDWCDDTSEQAIIAQDAGSGVATASHQYPVAGRYNVQVCITDDDNWVGCDNLTLEVLAAAQATARFAEFLASLDLPDG
jgi:hypothetical protein